MKQKKNSKKFRLLLIILISIILLPFVWKTGGYLYMNYSKDGRLHKHGFRLLEEQLAIYIEEHYEGVSKIEFSPIFEDGEDSYSTHTLNVIIAIYDNHGNRAVIDEGGNIPFGAANGLTMDYDGATGEEVIELDKYDSDEVIDVSNAKTLPKNAKLESYHILDTTIQYLVKTGKLIDVRKSDNGSRQVKVIYNTEIRKGDYTKWR